MSNKRSGFTKYIAEGIRNTIRIWLHELQLIFADSGVVIILLIAPLVYPVLYSVIYYPEVVRDMPVAVVDLSHSSDSRAFTRKLDATPEVRVASQCLSMQEATEMLKNREVHGIVQIPQDFANDIAAQKQATVSAYADMEFFLYYKALVTAVGYVSLETGEKIQTERLQDAGLNSTEIKAAVSPLDLVGHSIANPAAGFASYGIPVALILLIQQTIVLAIGVMAGTARERHHQHNLVSTDTRRLGTFRMVIGKSAAYFVIYALLSVYLLGFIPKWFGYAQAGSFYELAMLITPFLLSSIFMGMALSVLFRDRESAIMLYTFTTFPLMFLSGVTWPLSNFSEIWLIVRQLFPTSNAIFGFIKMNSLGATVFETRYEITALWTQALVYFLIACAVYAAQVKYAEKLREGIIPRFRNKIKPASTLQEKLAEEAGIITE